MACKVAKNAVKNMHTLLEYNFLLCLGAVVSAPSLAHPNFYMIVTS
jgi:hypothetical protein